MEQIIKQFKDFQASVEDLKTKLAESEAKRQQAEAELQKFRETRCQQTEAELQKFREARCQQTEAELQKFHEARCQQTEAELQKFREAKQPVVDLPTDDLRDVIDPSIPLKDRVAIRNDVINKLEFVKKYGLRLGVYLISKWWKDSAVTDDAILTLVKKNKNLAASLLPNKWGKIIETGIFDPKEIMDFIFCYDKEFYYFDKKFFNFQSDEILDYIVEQYKAGKKCPDFIHFIMAEWDIPFSFVLKLKQAGCEFSATSLNNGKFIHTAIQAKATKEQMKELWKDFNDLRLGATDFHYHVLFYYYPDLLEHFSTITLSIAYTLAYSGQRPESMKNNHDEFLRYLAKKLTTDDKIKFCVLLNVNWNEVGFDIKHEPLMKVREEFYAFIKKEFDAQVA